MIHALYLDTHVYKPSYQYGWKLQYSDTDLLNYWTAFFKDYNWRAFQTSLFNGSRVATMSGTISPVFLILLCQFGKTY
jgi:hypothetical protein